MLEYYFYSFVIRHEDMHVKNISSIYDNKRAVIAPLYDIACTGFYEGVKNFESHLPINGKQTNIRYNDFIKIVKKANVQTLLFKNAASKILKKYVEKMPQYISKISKLENIEFFIKERPNAQDKKANIKHKTTLQKIMQKHYEKRCKTLEKNGWFEKLDIKN